jgi:succinate dehydrogenase/fumarate reductase-like Fe-S protein
MSDEKAYKMRDDMQAGVVVPLVDLEKIRDVLLDCSAFFHHRDEMNAFVHMAKQTRMSPLTSAVAAAEGRITSIIGCNARMDVPK